MIIKEDIMDKIYCDGKLGDKEKCSKEATLIIRSKIDPIACVYYGCEKHKINYNKNDFIIEKL